jgi:hypothetical protein
MGAWQKQLEDERAKKLDKFAEDVKAVQAGNGKLAETMGVVIERLDGLDDDIARGEKTDDALWKANSRVMWLLITTLATVAGSAVLLALQIAGHL